MGTNYYLRHGICACCGRYDETHICKSFHTFHAPVEWDERGDSVVVIATWAAWKTRLRDECADGGRIFDEYGAEYPVGRFIAWAEEHGPDPERRQYEATRRAGYAVDKIEPHSTWVDADGFTFHAGEFS